jgi:hypothetical protein
LVPAPAGSIEDLQGRSILAAALCVLSRVEGAESRAGTRGGRIPDVPAIQEANADGYVEKRAFKVPICAEICCQNATLRQNIVWNRSNA